jgi:hypothetical protein
MLRDVGADERSGALDFGPGVACDEAVDPPDLLRLQHDPGVELSSL